MKNKTTAQTVSKSISKGGKSVKKQHKKYTKIALTLSICLLVMWAIMGTGTSIAWFTDTSPTKVNVFNIAELDLKVYYKTDTGEYKEVKSDTEIFDKEALYEPGYVQVVYLKIENNGDVPFDYKTAVTVNGYNTSTNVFGQTFALPEHLKFGVVTAEDEAGLTALLATRESAKDYAEADMPLNTYTTTPGSLDAGKESYLAVIVRMPEEVDNVANYRGEQPTVEMGITVSASQKGTLN